MGGAGCVKLYDTNILYIIIYFLNIREFATNSNTLMVSRRVQYNILKSVDKFLLVLYIYKAVCTIAAYATVAVIYTMSMYHEPSTAPQSDRRTQERHTLGRPAPNARQLRETIPTLVALAWVDHAACSWRGLGAQAQARLFDGFIGIKWTILLQLRLAFSTGSSP